MQTRTKALAAWRRKLVEARLAKGWSREELAHHLQVTESQVYRWENGPSWPRRDSWPSLAAFIGIALDEFQQGKDPDDDPVPPWHYDRKAKKEATEKTLVANRAALVTYQHCNDEGSYLINDGSSTAAYATSLLTVLMERRATRPVTIFTNNVQVVCDIPRVVEGALFRGKTPAVELSLAPGRFDVGDRAVRGPTVLEWVKTNAPKAVSVLAATRFEAETIGPFGRDEDAEDVKSTILEHSNELLILLTASKLSAPIDESIDRGARRFEKMKGVWSDRLERLDTLWVVSTLDPVVLSLVNGAGDPRPALTSTQERQYSNARFLREKLGSRFVAMASTETPRTV